MGLGDYVFWTSIIRDLNTKVNNPNKKFSDKKNFILDKILHSKNSLKKYGYGIIGYQLNNEGQQIKFHLHIPYKGNVLSHSQAKQVFKNNPYVTINEKYPNLIFLIIKSDGYLKRTGNGDRILEMYDHMHVVEQYAKNINLKKYILRGDFHFTKEEKNKVKNYLPKKKFILIEPQNHKSYRASLNFEKFQNIVDKLNERFKNEFEIIQISPSKFADRKSKFLENCILYKDVFTYRETILFGKYAELAIVPHGGLSNGLAAVCTKVHAIYPCLHKPIMTKFDTETAYDISGGNHYYCLNESCPKCIKYNKNFNYDLILNNVISDLSNSSHDNKN